MSSDKVSSKKSKLGPEELKLKRKEAEERSAKLNQDVDALLGEIEALYKKCAKEHGVTIARLKKVAHQNSAMKPRRKTSDFNVMVYLKSKELNAGALFCELN